MRSTPPSAAHGCGLADREMFRSEVAEPARQRLLLAGLSLFAEHGYAKTSIRKIAVEAGTNVAAISYYFGGKEGLYKAVFWGGEAPAEDADADAAPMRIHSLEELFERILAPLRSGEAARSWMKLQRREMLEPTGLWQQKIDRGMVPVHAALVAFLCDRLGLRRPDDEVRALALLVIGPAVHLLVNCEIVDMVAPQLLDGGGAIDAWCARLVRSADAVIEAERHRRLAHAAHRPAPHTRTRATPGPSSIRSPRSKA